MPVIQARNISYQFSDGESLFQHISCTANKSRIGLVGRNGVGKSILAAILTGEMASSSGTVISPTSFATYRQQPLNSQVETLSIAEFIGKDIVLQALKKIEAGDCASKWFDLVGDEWNLSIDLNQQLQSMGLPANPDFPCALLSGGQLARLQLWQLFQRDVELLVLDEPSNHLDRDARQWLIEAIRQFKGAILLISHDRELLREMEEIWQLSDLGLKVFGGNYDFYAQQLSVEQQAVERQLAVLNKQKSELKKNAQRSREKAEQRASQGNKLRKEGSQPKVLLDGKKDRATANLSNRNKNESLRQMHLQEKEQKLMSRQQQVTNQTLHLADSISRSGNAVSMVDGILAFGSSTPITMQLGSGEKVHLVGKNGSGKSTLLKTLLGKQTLIAGELRVNSPVYYLDQHFAAIKAELTMIESLVCSCDGLKEQTARTLLAGIGFRRDKVFRQGGALSGGEKMKLSMLIASHQPCQPLLLLDEPDNHLDLDSKITLAKALKAYRGGFILVSHDKDFATESAVSRQITLQ